MSEREYHKPVMLDECMEALMDEGSEGTYIDVTFGGGGHSREILRRLGKRGRLISFDQDADAEARGRELEREDERFTFVRSNFRFITNWAHYHGVEEADGILADLGVSSHQFDEGERGFSFRDEEAAVDMRMNQSQTVSANTLLNTMDEGALADTLYNYGELKMARKIARAIVNARTDESKVWTIRELKEVVAPLLQREREKKEMAKVFQALRIEVNGEMRVLGEMLGQTAGLLKKEGRLVVMTYHSLEDRMVKNYIKTGSTEGKEERDFYGRMVAPLKAVNNKVIEPTDEEIEMNPRARSAKLRIAEKL